MYLWIKTRSQPARMAGLVYPRKQTSNPPVGIPALGKGKNDKSERHYRARLKNGPAVAIEGSGTSPDGSAMLSAWKPDREFGKFSLLAININYTPMFLDNDVVADG